MNYWPSSLHCDMDLQLLLLSLLLAFLLLLLLLLALKKGSISQHQSHEPPLPPSPWRLPVIGHIHHLVGKLPHHALRDLAVKHGPIMLLKIGQVDFMVISSREAAEEVMKTHDINFANRPQIAVAKVVGYGCSGILFSSYGSYWRQLRKVCTVELFSSRRVNSFTSVREEEIFNLIRDIFMTPRTEPIDLSKKFLTMSSNIICVAAVGKKIEHQIKHNLLPVAKEVTEAVSGFSFTDTFPSFKFMDFLTGTTFKLKRIHRKLDRITDEIIKQHQIKKASEAGDMEEDLVDVLLRVKERGDLEVPLTLDNIKAVILDLLLAGTDTSSITLEWAMSELIRNPQVMKKAQNEVREAMRGRTQVRQSDAGELNYLRLVIKETLRLHPPATLTIPRVAKETCEVFGFKIPAGSRVIISIWALGRDPKYWDDAECFKPERFEGSPIDFRGSNFEYIPFGAGRRICPGMQFALPSVELALAQLLFYFDWKLPDGMKPEDLDMTETSAAGAARKSELHLLATPHILLPDV